MLIHEVEPLSAEFLYESNSFEFNSIPD